MKTVTLSAAYIPLVDAAPLICAQEMGFAEAEGITLDLVKAPSWSSVRDMLAFGRVDAAHLLSPVPVAVAMGLGGAAAPLSAVSVLSVNGNVIGVSHDLEARLRKQGHGFGFADAGAAGADLVAALEGPLRVGVPFPFSMHAELLAYWLGGSGLPAGQLQIKTIPPPLMAQALGDGEIDAFCVGEPWGSIAVENGVGALLLPGKAIWQFAPEKVLAVRSEWAETEPHLLDRLMRAVWRAGRWLSHPDSAITAAEILSRPGYLNVPAEIVDRALSGRLTISARGEMRDVPGFLEFFQGAATFPWRSQAAWIATRIAAKSGQAPAHAAALGRSVFRTDIYRRALASTGADLPGASAKLEGAIRQSTPVASEGGRMFLGPDGFFDGQIFDPDEI